MRVILYQAHQNVVGGVETFNINFCKRMSKHYNILFVCDSGDPEKLREIKKYVDVVVYDEQFFEADIVIYSSAWGKRPEEHFKAKKYVQMVHADFNGLEKHWNFNYKKTPKVTEHWGGGETIARTFKERYGEDCKVVPYLLDDTIKPERVLRLITLSRIAKEKGFLRVVKLAKLLKENGKPFNWDIWGGGLDQGYVNNIKNQLKDIPEVSFRGEGKNLHSFVADADYLVQLSDTEGYSFSMYEALSLNTPVIATDFPNALEQVTDGKNGYIVDMNLDCVDKKFLNKLYSKIPEFEFKVRATEEDWIKVIGKPSKKDKVKIKNPPLIPVLCTKSYTDLLLQRRVVRGEIIKVSRFRANHLKGLGLINII